MASKKDSFQIASVEVASASKVAGFKKAKEEIRKPFNINEALQKSMAALKSQNIAK